VGFREQDLECGVWGFSFRLQILGFMVQGLEFGVKGVGFRV
jgi:hypothetical protein